MKTKIVIPAEQGDVTLIDAQVPERLLKAAKKRETTDGRAVLAFGEVTGHHHSLDSRNAYIVEANDDLRKLFNTQMGIPAQANILDAVLVVENPDVVKHQEHSHIEIKPGVRWVVIEQEYTPERILRAAD